MSLVWITLLLVVLLFFAATAIDIGLMYYTRNQLQVAADAAATAGGMDLQGGIDNTSTNPNVLLQEAARRKAWQFACKNTAFGDERKGEPVYLVTDSVQDCYSYASLSASQLNGGNVFSGDIVVGNWDRNRTDPCPSTGIVEPFCPANGNTNLSINAIKVVARRTFDAPVQNVSIGNNKVRLFLGQIFRVLGGESWRFMSTKAEAIASKSTVEMSPIPICLPTCNLPTPLEAAESPGADPYPGLAVYFTPSPAEPGVAWTNFVAGPGCSFNCGGGGQPNPPEIIPYIKGDKTPPDICMQYLCTTQGTMNNVIRELEDRLESERAKPEGTVILTSTEGWSVTVQGWKTFVPVVDVTSCGRDPHHACPGDPTGAPYYVSKVGEVVITYIGRINNRWGIKLVGLTDPKTVGGNRVAYIGQFDAVTSTYECPDCNSPSLPATMGTKLVK